MTATRPEVLLLDAGNTIVFLDHTVVAQLLNEAGETIEASALRDAQKTANHRYSGELKRQLSHDEAWFTFMDTLLIEAGVNAGIARKRTSLLREHHDEFNLWRRVPEGLRERLLAVKAAGVRLGVVSNSEGKLERLFQRVGLRDCFEVLIDSAHVGFRKPDPRLFQHALEHFAVGPDAALYAGDLPDVDVAGAQAAGLGAVLIDALDLYPTHSASLRLSSLHELCDRILHFDDTDD